MRKTLLAAFCTLAMVGTAQSEVIGSIATTWRMVGANDKISVERFDDPKVTNASCYVSYAQTGGLTGYIGLAEDPSRFSIACRATGPVSITQNIPSEFEEVFSRSTSILFKEMRVSRMLDTDKNVLVYLVWSTKLIDGSPFNSVTAIPVDR